MNLFDTIPLASLPGTPLPERMRPARLQDLVGQPQVLRQLQKFVAGKHLPNLIFWGPPGTGKTTAAQALSHEFNFEFVSVNATSSGAKELRELGERGRQRRIESRLQTILFVDEIHRFNKGQQDVLLPFLEKGDLILIGATTENPSYELNRALLSRCRLLVFERIAEAPLKDLLLRAVQLHTLTMDQFLAPDAAETLLHWADGDARKMLSAVADLLAEYRSSGEKPLTLEQVTDTLGNLVLGHDKASDQHYDLISAMIKSIRGSDADAGLYYMARLLKGGEDPIFIARRLVILASEDVGNADPRALQVATSGLQAVELVGLPEGAISLAQVVTYLASAPKSNRSYMGLKKAQEFIERTGALPVPLALRSAKTSAMKDLGYGKGYQYPHDFPRHHVQQNYMPEGVNEKFYEPDEIGFEKQIREYLNWLHQKMR